MAGRFTSDSKLAGGAFLRGALRRAVPSALLIALVMAIGLAQRGGIFSDIDTALMQAAGAARIAPAFAWMTPLLRGVSVVGDFPFRMGIALVLGALLWWRGRRRGALWLPVTVLVGAWLNTAIKAIFAATRPDVIAHLDPVTSYSFPSGHAAGAIVLGAALALLWPGRASWALVVVWAALIGFSRLWLGVHWPSDIVAGWISGAAWIMLCAPWRGEKL